MFNHDSYMSSATLTYYMSSGQHIDLLHVSTKVYTVRTIDISAYASIGRKNNYYFFFPSFGIPINFFYTRG